MQPAASNRSGGKIFEFVPVAGNAGGSAMLEVETSVLTVVVEMSTAEVVVTGTVVAVVVAISLSL